MQKTTDGPVMAGKDRLIDGKFEKDLLERSEVNRGMRALDPPTPPPPADVAWNSSE